MFREPGPATFIYIAPSGLVEIASHTNVVEIITGGTELWHPFVADRQPRTTTARSRGNSKSTIMDQRKFSYAAEQEPTLVWYTMNELAHGPRATNAAL